MKFRWFFVILVLVCGLSVLNAAQWEIDSFSINNGNYFPLYKLINSLRIERSWDFYTGKFILRNKGNYLMFLIEEEKIYFSKELKILKHPAIRKDGIIYIPQEMVKYILSMADKDYEYKFTDRGINIEQITKPPQIVQTKEENTNSNNNLTKEISPGVEDIQTNNKKDYLINATPDKINVIVIDPGHGGKDPGAIGQLGLCEKDVVLKVALKVESLLKKQLPGVKIVMTRDKDVFIPLKNRAQIANKQINKNRAGIFLSIHANASYNKKSTGYETFVLSPVASDDEARAVAAMENGIIDPLPSNSTSVGRIISQLLSNEYIRESYKLANYIQSGYKRYRPKDVEDRGIKKALFYVLEGTLMPSVLTEIGFITNREEEKRMRDNDYQWKIAKSITDGIVNFVNWYESHNGFIQ